jgi:hypothetical protein
VPSDQENPADRENTAFTALTEPLVQVLTVTGGRIARITSFNDPALAPVFGLAPAGRTADNDA